MKEKWAIARVGRLAAGAPRAVRAPSFLVCHPPLTGACVSSFPWPPLHSSTTISSLPSFLPRPHPRLRLAAGPAPRPPMAATAAVAIHQFAECITCHAWSPDQSSNAPLPFPLLLSRSRSRSSAGALPFSILNRRRWLRISTSGVQDRVPRVSTRAWTASVIRRDQTLIGAMPNGPSMNNQMPG